MWDGPVATAQRTSSTATRKTNGTGTRAGRGSRPAQFLAAVTDSPGITANDLASEMECNINYVYRLAKDLDGQVEKRGKGFFPVGEDDVAPEDQVDPAEVAQAEGEPVGSGAGTKMLTLIEANPGISVPTLARDTGFTTMWVYRLVWELLEAGRVRRWKDGRTWRYTAVPVVENAHVDA